MRVIGSKVSLFDDPTNVDVRKLLGGPFVQVNFGRLIEEWIMFAKDFAVSAAQTIRAVLLIIDGRDVLHPKPDELLWLEVVFEFYRAHGVLSLVFKF
jgi:hypothetical protein